MLDAAIEISNAERAFIMLAGVDSQLEFKMARGRQKQTLTDSTFATSRKIPEEVYRLGKTKAVADLLDGDLADAHMGTLALGIRNVVCLPLNFVRYVEAEEARGEDQRIGVLYLDSRERGSLISDSTRAALETLAAEASVAIENARLYRDKLEKGKLEQEMRIAAEIQQSLLPKARASRWGSWKRPLPAFRAAPSEGTSSTTSTPRGTPSASRSVTSPEKGRPPRS